MARTVLEHHSKGLAMIARTILITGASKGIGRALAERLSSAGHHVVGLARGADPSFPGELVSVDLADLVAARATIAELAARRAFDGLVHNVGLVRPQRFGAIELDDLDDVLRVNLHPAVLASQALAPGMKARGWGRIVNVASQTVLGAVERTAYAASKAALVSFTRSWALERCAVGSDTNSA
jgi:NAD(P)-dependent dehydrogenase (short-subunit alcohol dehydrogenase family)